MSFYDFTKEIIDTAHRDGNSDEAKAIRPLLIREALKQRENVGEIISSELRQFAAQTEDLEKKRVFLAAADLLSRQG